MTYKQQVLSLFLISISYFSFGQSDLGVLISNNSLSKVTLEWRKPVFEKMNFKLGIVAGNENRFSPRATPTINVQNDTISQLYQTSNRGKIALKFGVERQIKSSVFYYGVDLITGYQSNRISRYEVLTPVNADSMDLYIQSFGNTGDNSTAHFLSTGVLGTIGMNLPISKRFLFNVSAGIGSNINSLIQNTASTNNNPTTFGGQTSTTIDAYMTGSIGIRYRFFKSEK